MKAQFKILTIDNGYIIIMDNGYEQQLTLTGKINTLAEAKEIIVDFYKNSTFLLE